VQLDLSDDGDLLRINDALRDGLFVPEGVLWDGDRGELRLDVWVAGPETAAVRRVLPFLWKVQPKYICHRLVLHGAETVAIELKDEGANLFDAIGWRSPGTLEITIGGNGRIELRGARILGRLSVTDDMPPADLGWHLAVSRLAPT